MGDATMLLRRWAIFCSLLNLGAAAGFSRRNYTNPACRYLPGDQGWPSLDQWAQLNASVSGRLIATVPAGHVCHDPYFNATLCAALQQTWVFPQSQ